MRTASVLHPRGAVGTVVQSPADLWHSYRVRFVGGVEASFRRQELSVLRAFKTGGVIGADAGVFSGDDPLAEYDLTPHVILSLRRRLARVRPRRRRPPTPIFAASIFRPRADTGPSTACPNNSKNRTTKRSTGKHKSSFTLVLKANPNVLECLYTTRVEHVSPIAQRLLDIRDRLLSRNGLPNLQRLRREPVQETSERLAQQKAR